MSSLQQLLVQTIHFPLTGQFCNQSCDGICLLLSGTRTDLYVYHLTVKSLMLFFAYMHRHCINRLHILPSCRTYAQYSLAIALHDSCYAMLSACSGSPHNALHSSSLLYSAQAHNTMLRVHLTHIMMLKAHSDSQYDAQGSLEPQYNAQGSLRFTVRLKAHLSSQYDAQRLTPGPQLKI